MSEDDMTGPHDDVTARLQRLRTPGPRPPAGGARRARRSAGRRQATRVAGVAVAMAALVVSVPVLLDGDVTATPPAVSVSPEPTTATAPAPDPTVPAPEPTAPSPGPSAPEPSGAPVPSGAPAPQTGGTVDAGPDPGPVDAPVLAVQATDSEPAAAGVLADFDQPGRDTSGEGASGGGVTWPLDPCAPTAWPQDANRTGWWAWSDYLGDSGTDRAVAVLRTEADAADMVAGVGRATQACWGAPDDPGATEIWQTYPVAGADVLRGVVRTYDPDGTAQTPQGAGTVAVVRRGRVVAMVVLQGGFSGSYAAVAQGDDRPGAGGGFFADLSQADAQADLLAALEAAQEQATTLAEQAAAHAGAG